jgi:hypothetical protein
MPWAVKLKRKEKVIFILTVRLAPVGVRRYRKELKSSYVLAAVLTFQVYVLAHTTYFLEKQLKHALHAAMAICRALEILYKAAGCVVRNASCGIILPCPQFCCAIGRLRPILVGL